jgi:hypothetical protein
LHGLEGHGCTHIFETMFIRAPVANAVVVSVIVAEILALAVSLVGG